MVSIHRLKLLLEIPQNDTSYDELLYEIIYSAQKYAADYCGMEEYDDALDFAVLRMAAEDFGRLGSEGTSYKYFSGFSETYRGTYSDQIKEMLRIHRKLKAI